MPYYEIISKFEWEEIVEAETEDEALKQSWDFPNRVHDLTFIGTETKEVNKPDCWDE